MELLQGLIAQSETYDGSKHDHSGRAVALHFNPDAKLLVPPTFMAEEHALSMTEWASRQVYSKLGPVVFGKGSTKSLPFDYLSALDPDQRADNLNRHLSKANGREWLVRGYGDKCRAVLDAGYPVVKNTELLQALDGLMDAEAAKFPSLQLVRPSVTPDDLNVKIVWQNIDRVGPEVKGYGGPKVPYGLGCYIGNGEIGNRKVRLLPLVQMHACTNSLMLDTGEESLVLAHRGSLASIMVLLKAALGRIFRTSAELLDKLILAEAEKIPDLSDVLTGLAKEHQWTPEIGAAVYYGMGGLDTRAGLVQGVTWAAHAAVEDPNDQADMEVLGGRILVADSSLFGRAAQMARNEAEMIVVRR